MLINDDSKFETINHDCLRIIEQCSTQPMQLVQASENLQNCRDHSPVIDSGSFSYALLFIDGEFATITNIFTNLLSVLKME